MSLSASLLPCYTLSRLKGIETNPSAFAAALTSPACYTLSRLKGIETSIPYIHAIIAHSPLAIHFPVWRELKLIPLGTRVSLKVSVACYTLSRLKGIETVRSSKTVTTVRETCYTLSRLKGIETFRTLLFRLPLTMLAIHFPVWRELKPHHKGEPVFVGAFLLYTFPFEGNWNLLFHPYPSALYWVLAIHFPVWRELKLFSARLVRLSHIDPCYTLSRLKGIET